MRKFLMCLGMTIVCVTGCRKSEHGFPNSVSPSLFSSDVIDKWFALEIRLFTNAKGIANGAFARPFAYSGISAYESIDPGKDYWKNKYNGLSDLPETEKHKSYYWPLSVNASLAEFNRSFFTIANSGADDIAAIDSLENAIRTTFSSLPNDVADRSIGFGKSIADAVYQWSQTDGYNENNVLPYTPPVGPGLWERTPPAFASAIGPFWKNNRLIIKGSGIRLEPPPPVAYSEDPNSAFYHMVNELYSASK